ncbi:MAG: zinc ribbon domain-containing protein [Dehalococcoidales bacterium]|jgi:hypothetical protein|nr:zinc ribbon domain-containing protein [Dehalococcoidales bacterium]
MTEQKEQRKQLFCPYCDEEIKMGSCLTSANIALRQIPEFLCCQFCGVTMFYCPECRKPVARDKRMCPHCGAEIKSVKPK